MIWLKYEILYRFRVSQITGNLLGDISSLREHHDTSLCTDPAIGVEGNSHRVEKRSYLPPVTCTSFHEQNAVRSKVHCQPRPRVIRLPWPNDTSVQTVSHPTCMIREIGGNSRWNLSNCIYITCSYYCEIAIWVT